MYDYSSLFHSSSDFSNSSSHCVKVYDCLTVGFLSTSFYHSTKTKRSRRRVLKIDLNLIDKIYLNFDRLIFRDGILFVHLLLLLY